MTHRSHAPPKATLLLNASPDAAHADSELAAAAVALRDMAVEADLLAPLLGQPGGGALLRGSRDGPPGLQVRARRMLVGRH